MLRERFDLVTQLHEEIAKFRESHGIEPKAVLMSPSAFEWLIAIFQEDRRILGISPINTADWTYDTGTDTIQLRIDESLDDYTYEYQNGN